MPRSRQLAPGPERSAGRPTVPESLGYRLKNRILGRPLVSEQLTQERLSNPVAIGVLAPDMISSSAYGTEEMLLIMVPVIGVAAFSMVIPITLAILAVMLFVMSSYMQVIGVYTRNGGSYVVARDNFGPRVAQVAAVALLIDYTVTVAVQTSAGTAALTSAIPSLVPFTVAITVGVTLVMLFGNLRGIREGPRAVPPGVPRREQPRHAGVDRELARRASGTVAIGEIAFRERVRVAGRIRTLGCRLRREPRTWSARSPTTRATCCWSSRDGGGFPGSRSELD